MATNPYNDDKRMLELLERWQSGDFSRANEQELQALTDSDEFRRETVEGFWALPETDHAKHLASLRDRLRRRGGGGRTIPLVQVISAVAAIGLLVLAVVWLLPTNESSVPASETAAQKSIENQPIASNIPEQSNNAPQTAGKRENSQAGPGGSAIQSKPGSPRLDALSEGSGTADEIAAAPPTVVTGEEANKDVAIQGYSSVPEKQVPAPQKAMEDKMDDLEEAPGSLATRSEPEQKMGKAKDATKKKTAPGAQNSQPAGGWTAFREYLRRNARLPEQARQNNVSGTVRLKFRLDNQNQPVDFETLQSLGFGCDQEAIRLVKSYSWQRGADPEITLDIPFVR